MIKEELIKAIKGLIMFAQDCQYNEVVRLSLSNTINIERFSEDGFLDTEELEKEILKTLEQL